MDGIQLMVLAFQLVVATFIFLIGWQSHRRNSAQFAAVREEVAAIRNAVEKLLSESETGYYDLLQTVEAVEKGVKKTAGLVLAHSTPEEDESLPPLSVLDKKHLAASLHQQGLTPDEISNRLDIPHGELALMLRMADRSGGASAA